MPMSMSQLSALARINKNDTPRDRGKLQLYKKHQVPVLVSGRVLWSCREIVASAANHASSSFLRAAGLGGP